jgi:hypothetical protein
VFFARKEMLLSKKYLMLKKQKKAETIPPFFVFSVILSFPTKD